jgi:dTDP-4-dehydrorhamnose reductase
MKSLVIGANGLVGRRVVSALLAQGHTVSAVIRGQKRFTGDAKVFTCDVSDEIQMTHAVETVEPDFIVNCAAMTDVDGCERDSHGAYVANVESVALLANLARKSGAFLTHISTDYVFDGLKGSYLPDDIPNPKGIYAVTKHMGEQAVAVLCEKDRFAICRAAVVYGWPQASNKNFGSWLVESLAKKSAVKLFDDQWVSTSLADNVADMLCEISTRKLSGIWHTCGSEIVDRVTFGHLLCDEFGFEKSLISPSKMSDVKLLSPRPAKSGLDVTKTKHELNVKPMGIKDSLQIFHEQYKRSIT